MRMSSILGGKGLDPRERYTWGALLVGLGYLWLRKVSCPPSTLVCPPVQFFPPQQCPPCNTGQNFQGGK